MQSAACTLISTVHIMTICSVFYSICSRVVFIVLSLVCTPWKPSHTEPMTNNPLVPPGLPQFHKPNPQPSNPWSLILSSPSRPREYATFSAARHGSSVRRTGATWCGSNRAGQLEATRGALVQHGARAASGSAGSSMGRDIVRQGSISWFRFGSWEILWMIFFFWFVNVETWRGREDTSSFFKWRIPKRTTRYLRRYTFAKEGSRY